MDWTKERIVELLKTNDRAAERALVVLFNRQTSEEQASLQTREHNGRGFSAYDAEFLSSLALRVIGGKNLTEKQLEVLRRGPKGKLGKYAGQLLEEVKLREAQQS